MLNWGGACSYSKVLTLLSRFHPHEDGALSTAEGSTQCNRWCSASDLLLCSVVIGASTVAALILHAIFEHGVCRAARDAGVEEVFRHGGRGSAMFSDHLCCSPAGTVGGVCLALSGARRRHGLSGAKKERERGTTNRSRFCKKRMEKKQKKAHSLCRRLPRRGNSMRSSKRRGFRRS